MGTRAVLVFWSLRHRATRPSPRLQAEGEAGEFKWADEAFQVRLQENVDPAYLQEEGPNAGRRFCARAVSASATGFFEWAAREKLDAALGDQLRPLLRPLCATSSTLRLRGRGEGD